MDKYIKVIENLKKGFWGEYLKFSLIGVMEVALEDYDSGAIAATEFAEIKRMANGCSERMGI